MEERKHFAPDFDNVLGGYHGYDPNNSSVSRSNVRALVEGLFDYDTIQMNGADTSWVAFWKYIHEREEFWWNYFCGQDVKSSSGPEGKLSSEAITEWFFEKK